MFRLTQAFYGREAASAGEPYAGYTNPYGKVPDLTYKYTQMRTEFLQKAFLTIPQTVRLIVEVGSFIGGSATVMGRFVQSRALQGLPAPPILCFDTWLGDLQIITGHYRKQYDRRFGQPQLYHQFLTNIIHANLTKHVLPMMAG